VQSNTTAIKTENLAYSSELKAEEDLSEDGECRVGTVASARRLFESLSSPVRSVADTEWTSTTRQQKTRQNKSDSESSSSGYSSMSAVANRRESVSSSETNIGSSNPDEFTDTSVDLPGNVLKDTGTAARSDVVCVGPSDIDASHYSLVVASDSLSGPDDDVSQDEVFLAAVGDDVTSATVQLQTDQQVTSLCNNVVDYPSPECINGVDPAVDRAATSGEDQDNQLDTADVKLVNKGCRFILMNSHSLLEEDEDDSLEGVQNKTMTMRSCEDLPPEHEVVSSEIDMKIYRTSTSECSRWSTGGNIYKTPVSEFYSDCDTDMLLADEEECTCDSWPEATQPCHVSTNEYGQVQLHSERTLQEQKSLQCVGYLDDGNDQYDMNRLSVEYATASRSTVCGMVPGRRRSALVKSQSRPCYSSVIHIGSQPDDVVIEDTLYPIETVKDKLRPLPDTRRIVEARDQQVSVHRTPWNDEGPIIIVYDGNADCVIGNCSEIDGFDDVDELMTSPSRDTHLFAPPVTRRSRVFHSR